MSNVIAFPFVDQVASQADPRYGLGHRMLTLEQICEWLNITERHARKLVEREAIPYRKVGRLLRFYEPDVDEWTRPAPKTLPLPTAPAAHPRAIPRPRATSHQRISMSSLHS